ncbi:transcriptional regulator [Acinetobacter soli]|uniref:transcriptional regulator n=1 Tax=Acinetobacter soli TaxID=487316 RepID=UPI002FF41562
MTLREKILFLTNLGYTQQKIEEKTKIEQSSISRILNNVQKSVRYEKGLALDLLVMEEKSQQQITQDVI